MWGTKILHRQHILKLHPGGAQVRNMRPEGVHGAAALSNVLQLTSFGSAHHSATAKIIFKKKNTIQLYKARHCAPDRRVKGDALPRDFDFHTQHHRYSRLVRWYVIEQYEVYGHGKVQSDKPCRRSFAHLICLNKQLSDFERGAAEGTARLSMAHY